MAESLRDKAKKLAARPYTLRILVDASEPEQPLYLAMNPELEGCMAQGETVEEAANNLAEFRIDYIEHLLEHDLTVPYPASEATVTGDLSHRRTITIKLKNIEQSSLNKELDKAAQLEQQDLLYEAWSKT